VTGAAAGAAVADVATTESGKRQTFAADMVYMADAALVTVCVTGRRYPVAMEADYLKMERAYSAQAQPPGSPLHVTFDGAILQRPKMEGGGTEATVVVQRFINTWPGESCERARADASLADTYWKIARLGTNDVKTATGQREPHLLIRSPAKDGLQGDYSATVGCNTIRGSYAAAGSTLKFSPGASTRMACAPPLDALERQLGDLLARTVRWSLKATTLELFDAGDGTLGLFQAVYF
jgi:heat shock protein HslJ